MRSPKLTLRKDTVVDLSPAELVVVAAGVQTLQSGCQSGVRACDPPTFDCFTHATEFCQSALC